MAVTTEAQRKVRCAAVVEVCHPRAPFSPNELCRRLGERARWVIALCERAPGRRTTEVGRGAHA